MNHSRTFIWQMIVLPFKQKFTHNSAERLQTETVVVEIKNDTGTSGFGESCPRQYVTNENFESVQNFYESYKDQIEKIYNLEDLTTFKELEKYILVKNPAAWCAIECALLDLLAREKNVPIEELLGLLFLKDKTSYTAVIGIDNAFSFFKKALKYRLYGFTDFKIKLCGNLVQDKNSLRLLSCLGVDKKHIRVDGNNLWSDSDMAFTYLDNLKKYIWSVEEPLQAFQYTEMSALAEKLDLKIILDESFLNLESLEKIKGQEKYFIPNVRISKMGGVLNTLKLVKELEKQNFHWVLGTHVGEMSLLARASLLILNSQKKSLLVAKEGGFSTHLLSEDLFYPNLKFSIGAKINLSKLGMDFYLKPGWNMTYQKKKGVK